jgi:hypothetical protein
MPAGRGENRSSVPSDEIGNPAFTGCTDRKA